MSLRWDISEVKDFKTVCYLIAEEDQWSRGIKAGDEMLNPVTEALIWHTVAVGMHSITEENAAEFFARVSLVEKLTGPSLVKQGGPVALTPEDVLAHVGLGTNASSLTKTKFVNQHVGDYLRMESARFNRVRDRETVTQ